MYVHIYKSNANIKWTCATTRTDAHKYRLKYTNNQRDICKGGHDNYCDCTCCGDCAHDSVCTRMCT